MMTHRFDYGVSLYSYTGEFGTTLTLDDCIDDVADLGATGHEIVHGKRRVTADTGYTPGSLLRHWLNLQTRYDLEIERDNLGSTLEHIRPL
jgi:hypothetical protein